MGLVRGVARTAMIAGTATAVSNRVSRRQAGRWAAQDQAAYEQQQAAYPQQAPAYQEPAYAAPPPSAPPASAESLAKLKQLADLKDQGILTEAEFEAQKQRILAG